MSVSVSRRQILLGSVAAGTAGWALGNAPSLAYAGTGNYDSRQEFDVAEQAYLDKAAGNNEGGDYAWGASYYLLGLLRMYEAYEDPNYLGRFADHSRHLLNTTDESRSVEDYRGRSGPVWRAAGDYTAAHGTLTDSHNRPVMQIRWAGTRGEETTGSVTDVADGRFSLTLVNPTTDTLRLTDVSLDPHDDRYVLAMISAAYDSATARWTARDLRNRRQRHRHGVAPGSVPFVSQYYVFGAHTGMISYPLAKFVRIILHSDDLRRQRGLRRLASRLLAAARAAVAFHDREFHHSNGRGDYAFPKGAPIPFDGTIAPYNQSHALGQTMTELHRIGGGENYRRKITAMLRGYQRGITTSGHGAAHWPYWPVYSQVFQGYTEADGISEYTPSQSPATQVEDVSHGAISAEFTYAAAEAGERRHARPERLAATYIRNLMLGDGWVAQRVDGTGEAGSSTAVQCARWGEYAHYDSEIYRHALHVYRAARLTPDQGSHALGIAYLNWGKRKGRQ